LTFKFANSEMDQAKIKLLTYSSVNLRSKKLQEEQLYTKCA